MHSRDDLVGYMEACVVAKSTDGGGGIKIKRITTIVIRGVHLRLSWDPYGATLRSHRSSMRPQLISHMNSGLETIPEHIGGIASLV